MMHILRMILLAVTMPWILAGKEFYHTFFFEAQLEGALHRIRMNLGVLASRFTHLDISVEMPLNWPVQRIDVYHEWKEGPARYTRKLLSFTLDHRSGELGEINYLEYKLGGELTSRGFEPGDVPEILGRVAAELEAYVHNFNLYDAGEEKIAS